MCEQQSSDCLSVLLIFSSSECYLHYDPGDIFELTHGTDSDYYYACAFGEKWKPGMWNAIASVHVVFVSH